jgi:hypothetical protein
MLVTAHIKVQYCIAMELVSQATDLRDVTVDRARNSTGYIALIRALQGPL